MQDLRASLRPAIVSLLVFTGLVGIVYPLTIGAIGTIVPKPSPAELVGQPFDDPAYFWSRPSAVGYDALASGGTNAGAAGYIDDRGTLGPNQALVNAARGRIQALRDADPGATAKVPVDLVTSSSSGLDPHISPAAAYYQVPRVARLRGATEAEVRGIVDAYIEERTFGLLGERRVNVVRLNRGLDREVGPPNP